MPYYSYVSIAYIRGEKKGEDEILSLNKQFIDSNKKSYEDIFIQIGVKLFVCPKMLSK